MQFLVVCNKPAQGGMLSAGRLAPKSDQQPNPTTSTMDSMSISALRPLFQFMRLRLQPIKKPG